MNDEVVGAFELTAAYFGEVGGFGMVGAQEAVVALDGAFLPSAVGMAVVDGDVKEGLKRVFMKEFGAVVGEDGLEFVAIGTAIAAEVPEGVGHGGLGDCWEVVKIKTAGFVWIVVVRVDEREQAAVAVGGVDGVHLEVAGLGMVPRGQWEFVDHVLWGVVARGIDGDWPASLFLAVVLMDERLAVFVQKFASGHESIDGATAGDVVVVRFLAKRIQRIEDTLFLGILLCEGIHEEGGDLAAWAFVRSAAAGLRHGKFLAEVNVLPLPFGWEPKGEPVGGRSFSENVSHGRLRLPDEICESPDRGLFGDLLIPNPQLDAQFHVGLAFFANERFLRPLSFFGRSDTLLHIVGSPPRGRPLRGTGGRAPPILPS